MADIISEKEEEVSESLEESKGEGEVGGEVSRSTSNLAEALHGGRPKNEEAHVSRKKLRHGEKVELLVKVELDELGINEDEFDDLQSLFQLFDYDKDGILNLRETQKLLRCLGFKANEEQTRAMIGQVSVDTRQASLSFNEYLRLVSCQRRADPDETTLLAVFETFDPANTGRIPEIQFRKIMSSKATIPDEEVEEMLAEYRKLEIVRDDAVSNASSGSSSIFYKGSPRHIFNHTIVSESAVLSFVLLLSGFSNTAAHFYFHHKTW